MSAVEWRYLPGGSVKHALSLPTVFGPVCVAVCGMNAWSSAYWHGAGSQFEYEECERRRPCMRCAAKVGAPK